MVDVRYKCRCMLVEASVDVPERGPTEDVVHYVTQTMGGVISADHFQRNPYCRAREMEYAKIYLPTGSNRVGGPSLN